MKVTIKDIAEKAGVHRATVDKVLHNRVGVSDAVRKHVQEIIDEMGYVPNPVGQILQKQGRMYRIRAILVEVDALSFLKKGIENGIKKQTELDIEVQYKICSFHNIEKQLEYIEQAIADKVDGIIINPINSNRIKKAINEAEALGIMVVTANSDIEDSKRSCYVGIDSKRGGRIAGRLLGQFLGGKGKVAIITSAIDSENNSYDVVIREKSFQEFIKHEYPQIEVVSIINSFEDPNITYKETMKLLEENKELDGIYITCGGVSIVGKAIEQSKRANDIKVISYEDYPEIVELIRQGIIDCTLAGEIQRQGELPLELIMQYLIFGRKPSSRYIPTEIKILVKECLF